MSGEIEVADAPDTSQLMAFYRQLNPKYRALARAYMQGWCACESAREPKATTIEDRLAIVVDKIGGPTKAAHILGVSRHTLWKWQRGQTGLSLDAALRLATAAHVTLDWLAVGLDRRPDMQAEG